MNHPAGPSQEYLRNTVMTASPEQLQLMLYDGAIRFATRGGDEIAAGNREGAFIALDRAQRIMLELSNGLRREANPQLADQMAALYGFVYRRLVEASLHQDSAAVQDALRILRLQRETWVLLMDKLREEQARSAAPSSPPAAARPTAAGASRFSPGLESTALSTEG
jgi:flagellar protein FliS